MKQEPGKKEDQTKAIHDLQIVRLKKELNDRNEKYKDVLSQLHESEERWSALLRLQRQTKNQPPVTMKVRAVGKPHEATAVLVASDWHLEERVDANTVDGVNEYNPEIATSRIRNFFERGLSMVEMARTRSTIDTLVLAVLGDLITNTLHEDQAESNYLSPTEATLKAYRLLCGGIEFLAREGNFKQIIIPCNFGNHGRTTKKMRVATAAKNSYEWLMYNLVAEHFANEPRIRFIIADGYFNFLEIYNTTLRLHHGNGIMYQGGVGGVDIPLNKAIAQWNKMRKVDIDILGHWHTRKQSRDFVINGSVIGYNAYSIQIKASYEPPVQSFFLIHPEWGKTIEAPICLT